VLDRGAGVVRRTPPAGHPADRAHTLRVATAHDGKWEVTALTVDGAEAPLPAGDAPVVLDPFEDTWALVRPDQQTLEALPALLPGTDDARLRAGIWNNVRSGFHNAAVAPDAVVDLWVAGLPTEDCDDALQYTTPWLLTKVVPLTGDPAAALDRIHDAAMARAGSAAVGSTLQLAAFQLAASSARDSGLLRAWLAGDRLPDGIELDLDLRWRILVQLAGLGAVDRTELQAALDAEPTNRSRVEHSRAMASLPDAEAKAWAWARFTGEVDVPNYELEAAGLGMWRPGQEELTTPYVARYFAELPGTVEVRSGWVLADAAEAFFPTTALQESTAEQARALIADQDLDPALRRRVVDLADELGRRLAIQRAYPTP
jgi:aminopeptidase N